MVVRICVTDIVKQIKDDWFQIFAILLVSIPAFTMGLIVSWPSPSTLKILNDKATYSITFDEVSYFILIAPLGMIASSLAFSKAIDRIGRKWVLWFVAVPQLIVWTLTAFARSIYVFYLMRFVAGTVEAGLFSALPSYVGEIATPKVSGSWGALPCFCIYLGKFTINAIGSHLTISTTARICTVFPLIFACAFVFMPESPYHLLMKDQEEAARRSLQKLRRKLDVEEELATIKQNVERQLSESGTWTDLFTVPVNRKAMACGVFLRSSQQLAGYGTFNVYTQYIFSKSGGDFSAGSSAMIFMGTLAVLALFNGLTLDRFGRKRSFFWSTLLCGVALTGETVYFGIISTTTTDDSLKWFPLAGMVLYIVAFSFGLASVPTLMLGELFSASVKGKALCLMNVVFGVLLTVVPKVFHLLDKHFGLCAPFLLFSVCCFASAACTDRFVPETGGKTLEEIQQAMKKGDGEGNVTTCTKDQKCVECDSTYV